MFVRPRSRLSLLLLLLCAGLGWLVNEELRGELWPRRPPTVQVARPATVEAPKPLPRFALPEVVQFEATTERPLFLPTRRRIEPEEPPAPEAAPAPEVKKPPLEVVVSGVIMAESRQFALVRRQAGGETLRLAKGDTIDGWTVGSVLPDRVVFRRDEESKEVELKDGKPAKPKPERRRGRRRATAKAKPPAEEDPAGRRRKRTRRE